LVRATGGCRTTRRGKEIPDLRTSTKGKASPLSLRSRKMEEGGKGRAKAVGGVRGLLSPLAEAKEKR